MDLLAVEHDVCQDAVVVHAKGDVDSSTVQELTAHLSAALELAGNHAARLVVVDLQAVTFFGSAGLNALLDCHQHGKAAGILVRLVADHGQVIQPIQVTELDRILDIYPTLSRALRRGSTASGAEPPP